MQSQGALAGRLRSFSMQDLRSLHEQSPVHFQDPLYLEEQQSLPQPLGEELGGITVWWRGSAELPVAVLGAGVSLCPQATSPGAATRARRTMRSCGRTRRCPPRCPHAVTPNPCPAARACGA